MGEITDKTLSEYKATDLLQESKKIKGITEGNWLSPCGWV